MTFAKIAEEFLSSNGMFDNQVEEVMKLVVEEMNEMNGRWNEDTDNYPPIMKNIVLLTVKATGLKWIEENAPQAWFKPMFAD